jgi:beta-fructofuranosidase
MPAANWMNDPNGLIQWNGTYHMFYQYNPHGAFHATMHWGHASSKDLVTWEHLPIALAPSPGGPDADGIFSGCAVNHEGVPTILYTGVRGDVQLPCLAISHDDDLITWEKDSDNPVITSPPAELDTTIFRDHSAWKDGDTWYQVIGSGIEGVGGTALLYRSPDFHTWEFVGSLVPLDLVADGVGEEATGWECPDFFESDGRHVLLVSMWAHRAINVSYFTGVYEDHLFVPEHQGVVDPGQSFYAPQSFADELGRRIMFGWLRESRSVDSQIEAGWSGVMSLPRILSVLPDGSLGTAPAPEVMQLRGTHRQFVAADVARDKILDLGDIPGNACELEINLTRGVTGTLKLDILKSPDDSEKSVITYSSETGSLTVDTTTSRYEGSTSVGAFTLQSPVPLTRAVTLRLFIDHSVIEAFLNDEKCISARAYTRRPDSCQIKITWDSSNSIVESVNIWSMAPLSSSSS